MRDRIVIGILLCLALLAITAFMTVNLRGNIAFALELRGVRLAALVTVAIAIALSTVTFQTITGNRILTPAIMGYEAVYLLFQAVLVLVLGTASLVVLGLSAWLQSGNLVLVYVLSVVVCGLKYGARPAIFTAVLSFLSFNFFLTEPYYTFFVNKNDDIATLVFMLVIGVVCGPAASRIRRQFLLLKEANRYSELQRDFAQQLTVINQPDELWATLATQLSQALDCPVHIVATTEQQQIIQALKQPLQALDQACHPISMAFMIPRDVFPSPLNLLIPSRMHRAISGISGMDLLILPPPLLKWSIPILRWAISG